MVLCEIANHEHNLIPSRPLPFYTPPLHVPNCMMIMCTRVTPLQKAGQAQLTVKMAIMKVQQAQRKKILGGQAKIRDLHSIYFESVGKKA